MAVLGDHDASREDADSATLVQCNQALPRVHLVSRSWCQSRLVRGRQSHLGRQHRLLRRGQHSLRDPRRCRLDGRSASENDRIGGVRFRPRRIIDSVHWGLIGGSVPRTVATRVALSGRAEGDGHSIQAWGERGLSHSATGPTAADAGPGTLPLESLESTGRFSAAGICPLGRYRASWP